MMSAMHAIHVFWTAPYRAHGTNLDDISVMTPLERLVLAASALVWRTHSGLITLYTDGPGYDLVHRWGLTEIWSAIDTRTLNSAPSDISPNVFWDLGKTLALASASLPITLLDLDLVVLEPLKVTAPVQFYHWEELEEPWYPPRCLLPTPSGYEFPDADWTCRAGNTALVHIDDELFRKEFVAESLRFSRGNLVRPNQSLAAFLFSGQRLFTLVGSRRPGLIVPFLPYLFAVHSPPVWLGPTHLQGNPLALNSYRSGSPHLHLWSHKHVLRRDHRAAQCFLKDFTAYIAIRFPTVGERLIQMIHREPMFQKNTANQQRN